MYKKITVAMLSLIMFSPCFAQEGIKSFSQCLKECSEYFSTQTISLPSISLTTKRQILGQDGNLCHYKETISSQNSVYTVNCKFNGEQRNSLAKALDEFDNDEKNENFDANDFTQVQSSSVYETWSKYLQDESVCQIDVK